MADDNSLDGVFDGAAGVPVASYVVDAAEAHEDVERVVRVGRALFALVVVDNNGDAVADNACKVRAVAWAAVAHGVAAAENRLDAALGADNIHPTDDGAAVVVVVLVA